MASKGVVSSITGIFSSRKAEKFETLLEQGRIEYESRDYQKAIGYLEKAVAESEDKEVHKKHLQLAHIYLGRSLDGLRKYDESVRHFDKAIEIDPRFHLAWYNKGCSLMDQNAYEKALKHFDKALELSPRFQEAVARKGDAYLLAGNLEKALEHYGEILAQDKENPHAKKQVEKIKTELRAREQRRKVSMNERWSEGLLNRR